MTVLTTQESILIDRYFIDNNIQEFNINTFNEAITKCLPWRRRSMLIEVGELGDYRKGVCYTEYVNKLIEREKFMKTIIQPMNDMSKQIILDLQNELEHAYETRECFVCGSDWNMVKLWDEQIDYIIRELQNLGYIE